MKKWIAILLTLSMALAFAACKGGDTGKPSQPDDDDDAQPSVGGMTLQALIDSGMLSELVPEDENAKMEFSVKGNDTLVMTYIFQKDFSAIEVAALKEQLANQDVQELADSMDGLKEGLGAVISVDDLKVEVIYQTKGGEVLFNQTF